MHDFEIVHAKGITKNTELIIDDGFGVSADNAYCLIRTVEMYQWKQSSFTTTGGGMRTRTYNYRLGWSDTPIDSDEFVRP